MKKLLGLVLVAGLIFAFSSCKKDWTCECSITYTDGTAASTISYEILKQTKSDAESLCEGYNMTAGTYSYACELQ